MLFCGIDTSNYTTSAAVCDGNGSIIANIKQPLPVGKGACGLRQSDAVFAHVRNLPEVMRRLGFTVGDEPVMAVGVSATPRDETDSYMPCFLAGVAAAESYAAGIGRKVYRFSHQAGHIAAAYRMSGADKDVGANGEFIAFHVSGGTTEVVRVQLDNGLPRIELIGGSADLNAGQAIDRVGVALGIHFPCGPEMERLARTITGSIPQPRISVKDVTCNLSGLQNLAKKMIADGAENGAVCSFVFDYIERTLFSLAINARRIYGELPIVWAGGVMSNTKIISGLSTLDHVYFAPPEFSADNAAGIALLAAAEYERRKRETNESCN